MTTALSTPDTYWKRFCGIELFKVKYLIQYWLYNLFGLKMPKLKSQHDYWASRGTVYMDEILASGYLEREIFFQDMLVNHLKKISFQSFFEAGCGFGWNIGRVAAEFPHTRVGGLDFSLSQLGNSRRYLADHPLPVVNADNCRMPLKDNAYDVGFSLGVFMNIHPDRIMEALAEMVRVCRRRIIHIEYDENHTTPALKEKRAFKTNIVSHDYQELYRALGIRVAEFHTFHDFGPDYHAHAETIKGNLDRWEGFEGPEKYIFIVLDVEGSR